MGLSTDFFVQTLFLMIAIFSDNVHRFLLDVRVLLKKNLVTWISSENSTLLDII